MKPCVGNVLRALLCAQFFPSHCIFTTGNFLVWLSDDLQQKNVQHDIFSRRQANLESSAWLLMLYTDEYYCVNLTFN